MCLFTILINIHYSMQSMHCILNYLTLYSFHCSLALGTNTNYRSPMHVSSSKDNYCTMQCAIACIDKVSDLKMLLDKKWLTWKFKTNSGRTAAEHMLNTASVRTENGGVEFHTHGNRKLRNSFHTYDNRKVCPSFNLFLKSTFSLTPGKNNGTALVVWQPTAGRHKGWQPQGAPAGLGSSHHYMQTTCWHKYWRKINLNIFMLQGPMAGKNIMQRTTLVPLIHLYTRGGLSRLQVVQTKSHFCKFYFIHWGDFCSTVWMNCVKNEYCGVLYAEKRFKQNSIWIQSFSSDNWKSKTAY